MILEQFSRSLPKCNANYYKVQKITVKMTMVGVLVNNGQFLIKNSIFANNFLSKLEKNLSSPLIIEDHNL